MRLPEGYESRVIAQLGREQADKYFEALSQPYTRGIRLNPRKPAPPPIGIEGSIPWEPMGRYLSLDSAAGALPLHEAGAYYLQEPSAMIPARVLAPRAGERVIDLCAAPGGKATQLASLMNGGLLVCNEPVPGRAKVLSRNIERMGVTNALVVSESPERLAALWEGMFDAVLVDAPCSGEGMFRRHPEAMSQWAKEAPEGCAKRQRAILKSAIALLRGGGRLCYSTCTNSFEEDEGCIQALLSEHPELSPVDFEVPLGEGRALKSRGGMVHIWPHQARCEGHFVALMEKRAGGERARLMPADKALRRPDDALLAAYRAFAQDTGIDQFEPAAQLGQTLVCCPELPPLSGIRVLRAGVSLGCLKGSVFAPDHALALALPEPPMGIRVDVTPEQAALYQAGEALPCPDGMRGYRALALDGVTLGFVKASDGLMKNHYPRGLRRAFPHEGE